MAHFPDRIPERGKTPSRLEAQVKRDPQGPDHAPEVMTHPTIEGVVLQTSPHVEYTNGVLTELFRPEWPGVFAPGEPIEHLYTVWSPQGGMRKEWYYHEHTLDRYMILRGRLDLGLYDGRDGSASRGSFDVVSLGEPSSGLPSAVRIPPGVWHSLKWASLDGMFLNAKLPRYNREVPDKFRVPLDELPEAITWNVG